MNIAVEQTEEYVNGQLKNKYGDAFLRGNNGKWQGDLWSADLIVGGLVLAGEVVLICSMMLGLKWADE